MNIRQHIPALTHLKHKPSPSKMALAALSLITTVVGCRDANLTFEGQANAQALPSPPPTNTVTPTAPPSPTATPTATPWPTVTPTTTPWPSPTPWPTATPWPTPAAWQPASATLPTLAPLPLLPSQAAPNGSSPAGLLPVSYSPPDGVDVFGSAILRWEYYGQLAPDEFFDIKIKPLGSDDSIFVDWSKTTEYELHPWSGWSPGLYTWQIGIIRGHLTGETKEFIADTGRDSEPFIIKWQAVGSAGGGSGGGDGGGGSSGGS